MKKLSDITVICFDHCYEHLYKTIETKMVKVRRLDVLAMYFLQERQRLYSVEEDYENCLTERKIWLRLRLLAMSIDENLF